MGTLSFYHSVRIDFTRLAADASVDLQLIVGMPRKVVVTHLALSSSSKCRVSAAKCEVSGAWCDVSVTKAVSLSSSLDPLTYPL